MATRTRTRNHRWARLRYNQAPIAFPKSVTGLRVRRDLSVSQTSSQKPALTADPNVPRPTREGNALFINGFPSGPKPYEEILTFLRKGSKLEKYGRHGSPKMHYFRLSDNVAELQWDSKNGRTRHVLISSIHKFQRGQETDIFKRFPQPKKALFSFSIIYTDELGKERSLDVICSDHQLEFEMWFWGLQVVRHYPPQQWTNYVPQQYHHHQQQLPMNRIGSVVRHYPPQQWTNYVPHQYHHQQQQMNQISSLGEMR
eukprot:gene32379-2571_t